ncbi:P-loop NTPase fold protein [Corallincola platygyrae]|uniref:P-loop NTPase fold protein n=1 Tax=Corallincola platygyrae TaxID=1193278 RepID=A0ABW4XQT5_9GAMM
MCDQEDSISLEASFPKFQTEEPSSEDLFDGQGHSHAANALKRVIEEDDSAHTLGLEGELGAGKSTIIKLLEDRLDQDRYHFVIFDVDTHHHSSIKTALIKVLQKEIKNLNQVNSLTQKRIDKAANQALGNVLEYTKRTNSSLSWLVIAYAVSIAFSIRYAKEGIESLITFFDTLFINNTNPLYLPFSVEALLGFSPLIVLLVNWRYNSYQLKKGKKKDVVRLADVFKRNSIDRIQETFDVSREVGSLELKDALTAFTQSIPEDKTIVLVIDNLDRVEARLVREIWSDLNIINALAGKKMKVLVPFSSAHVAKSLSDDDDNELYSGMEYISKRLPIVFQAPPIVTAGWRDQFRKLWEENLGNSVEGVNIAAELIDMWQRPGQGVTPRQLKKLINDIASILASCPAERLHGASCATYVLGLKNQHGKLTLEQLLSAEIPSQTIPEADDKARLKVQISQTHKLLNRSVGESDIWATQIACIHYQTLPDIAKSELLGEPIRAALTSADEERLIELSDVLGYDVFFERQIERSNPPALVELAARAVAHGDKGISWVDKWLPRFNRLSAESSAELSYSEDYVDAIEFLVKRGYDVDLSLVRSKQQKLQKSLREIDFPASEGSEQSVDHVYAYSKLLGKKPFVIENPPVKLFALLWTRKDNYSYWNIEETYLPLNSKSELLNLIANDDEFEHSSLYEWIREDHKLGLIDFSSNESPTANLSVGFDDDPESWLDILPFTTSWNESEGYIKELFEYFEDHEEQMSKELCEKILACILANLVATTTEGSIQMLNANRHLISQPRWAFIEPKLDKYPGYVSYLTDYLVFTKRFSSILTNLRLEHVSGYLSDAVKAMIASNRVHSLTIREILCDHYSSVRKLFKETELHVLINFCSGWLQYLKTSPSDWATKFIEDVIKHDNEGDWQQKLLSYIDANENSKETWLNWLAAPALNLKMVVTWLVDSETTIENFKGLYEALSAELSKSDSFSNMLDHSAFVALCAKLLPKNELNRLSNQAKNKVAEQPTSTTARSNIISCLGSIFTLQKATHPDVRSAYTLMVEKAEDDTVIQWLDNQRWYLNDWQDEERQQLLSAAESNPVGGYERLTRLIEKSSEGMKKSAVS